MHGGATGLRVKSTSSYSVIDIDANNGDAALRFYKDGTGQWIVRNNPGTDDLEIFELGGGGTRMIIQDATGNVGFGTTNPLNKFEVANGTSGQKFLATNLSSGHYGFGQEYNSANPAYFIGHGGSYWHFMYAATPATSYTALVTLDGPNSAFRPTSNNVISLGTSSSKWTAVYAVNGTIQTSDLRFKTNISDINYGLNEVMKLRPVSYSWKNEKMNIGTGKNLGFIAQELETIIPDVVIHTQTEIDKETGQLQNEFSDTYGVKYSEIVPVLVKAIQEQQAQIEQLKLEVKALKEK